MGRDPCTIDAGSDEPTRTADAFRLKLYCLEVATRLVLRPFHFFPSSLFRVLMKGWHVGVSLAFLEPLGNLTGERILVLVARIADFLEIVKCVP